MHDNTRSDRRRFPRHSTVQFGKILDPATGRYVPCTTRNVSRGGALIELARPLNIDAGSQLLMGLAASDRPSVLRSNEFSEVEVVRSAVDSDGRQQLAVMYVESHHAYAGSLRLAA